MGTWIFGGVVVAVVVGLLVLDWVMAGRVSRQLGRRPREDSPDALQAWGQTVNHAIERKGGDQAV